MLNLFDEREGGGSSPRSMPRGVMSLVLSVFLYQLAWAIDVSTV